MTTGTSHLIVELDYDTTQEDVDLIIKAISMFRRVVEVVPAETYPPLRRTKEDPK